MGSTNNGGIGKVHGEIVSWDVPAGKWIDYAKVLAALDGAGLDKGVARKMLHRNAFARACFHLSERRIIRKLSENGAEMKFQFTAESRDESLARLAYNYEAAVTLDKVTGKVTCAESPELEAKAQKLVNDAADVRSPADITRMVQTLFDREADLFPVREKGGVYFVPAKFEPFLEKVELFITAVGGNIRRFPVPVGTASGDKSVKASVEEGMAGFVAEHVAAIEAFDDTTRDSTLEKMVERINNTRFKAEAYADFLGEQKAAVEEALAEARKLLRQKVAALGRRTAVPEPEGAVEKAAPAAAAAGAGDDAPAYSDETFAVMA